MILGSDYKPQKRWLELGDSFSDPVTPADFPTLQLRLRNTLWAGRLGLNALTEGEWLDHFGRFHPLPNNLPQPLALRYHGHQFTHYNPDLGDGRGFLFAQLEDPLTHRLLDLGTKGSGKTPYSRQGDGRLTLKGAVREALATSYLEYQGANTSKTFSVIETGESLVRSDEPSPTRSAVLVRLSHSHIRIGSFQRLASIGDKSGMEKLLAYTISNYYPDSTIESVFSAIASNIAKTTAQWMIHGFVHGVLNTDNINITGESFDYGPYRFLPTYDPKFTAAYFDHGGLYAYSRQPQMVHWNLERLAEALQLTIGYKDIFTHGFSVYQSVFESEVLELFCKKIGIRSDSPKEKVRNLFYACLQFLEKSQCPYEAFFHHLYCWHQDLNQPLKKSSPTFYDNSAIDEICKELVQMDRDPLAPHRDVHDLQTMLIDEIESIWSEIDKNDNWKPFHDKIRTLENRHTKK